MCNKKLAGAALLTASVLAVYVYFIQQEGTHDMTQNAKVLTVALPEGWGPLTPPEQSMAMAEQILMAEFEVLISYDMQGNLIPQLAMAWESSTDLKTIIFTIDTSRQFSNGGHLTSGVFKKSFEHSLTVDPTSSNLSSLDVLNLVEGFENFKNSGVLSGIQTPSPDKLVIKFKKPFRRALAFLSGIRYAAFMITEDGKYLGTGPYRIESLSSREVNLSKNPYFPQHLGFESIRIIGLESREWGQAICEDKYDVYYNLDINKIESCSANRESDIDFTGGAIGGHVHLKLNALDGRIFSNPKLRMAMQYLVVRRVLPELQKHLNMNRVAFDPQFLAPLQQGRLSDDSADRIIDEGRQWVSDLIEYSKKKPIHFTTNNKKDLVILELLENLGVRFTESSAVFSAENTSTIYYKTFEYDMMYGGAGFGAQDPDDLYHLLGRNGAISSPTIQRDKVVAILEAGRSALTQEDLINAYKDLSSTILREVPVIHMGYLREGFLYNHNRVKIESQSMNTFAFNYTQFTPLLEGQKGGEK